MEDEKEQSRPDRERPEPEQATQPSSGAGTDPESAGGDSPCWAHLLDDDGRLT